MLIKQAKDLTEYKNFAEEYKKVVPYVMQAYFECADGGYLPGFTPQLILLALLYKETECNKEYLRFYYTQLDERYGCLVKPVDDAWQADTFKSSDRDALLRELQVAPLTQDRLQKLYETIVFVCFVADTYPPMATYADAVFKGKPFADCMDTALRNFINVLAYNAKTNRFDISLIEQRLGKTVHPRLKRFYVTEAHADASMLADKTVHSDWASMVSSDIPYIAYNDAVPAESQRVKGAPVL